MAFKLFSRNGVKMKIRDIICFYATIVANKLFMGISVVESIVIAAILFICLSKGRRNRK